VLNRREAILKKKVSDTPAGDLFPARKVLVSDFPAVDGKIANLF
jgi:hypothetical protein